MEDLSIQMETVRTYAPRWNFHMYRMQQLEKEVDEIEAEISKQEARFAKEDVPKEVSSLQLDGGRWEQLPDSYQAISNTKFAEVLRRECMVVIKTSYFKSVQHGGCSEYLRNSNYSSSTNSRESYVYLLTLSPKRRRLWKVSR